MYKHTARKLAMLVVLALMAGPVNRAFADGTAQTTTQTTLSSSAATSDGITGTDPEPIDPGVVSVILSLLGLA